MNPRRDRRTDRPRRNAAPRACTRARPRSGRVLYPGLPACRTSACGRSPGIAAILGQAGACARARAILNSACRSRVAHVCLIDPAAHALRRPPPRPNMAAPTCRTRRARHAVPRTHPALHRSPAAALRARAGECRRTGGHPRRRPRRRAGRAGDLRTRRRRDAAVGRAAADRAVRRPARRRNCCCTRSAPPTRTWTGRARRFRDVEDQDWERAWMDQYEPLQFGARTWIVPWNHELPDGADAPDAAVVRLDPGLAFGSGTHPTTALCLQWLDALADEGAAARRDACSISAAARASSPWPRSSSAPAQAIGVDNDPQALIATRRQRRAQRRRRSAGGATCPNDEPPPPIRSSSPTSSPRRWSRWPTRWPRASRRADASRCRASSPGRRTRSSHATRRLRPAARRAPGRLDARHRRAPPLRSTRRLIARACLNRPAMLVPLPRTAVSWSRSIASPDGRCRSAARVCDRGSSSRSATRTPPDVPRCDG